MTVAASHNGGKMQLNLGGLQYSGAFTYMNLILASQNWSRNGGGAPPAAGDDLDANGWPNGTFAGGVYTVFNLPSQSERPGNYVLKATSTAAIGLTMVNTVLPTASFTGSVASNVLTVSTTPTGGTVQKGMTLSTGGRVGDQISGTAGGQGTYNVVNGTNVGSQAMTVSGGSLTPVAGAIRYVFSTTSSSATLSCGAAAACTNIVFCHVDDEASIEAGNLFGAKFKQRLIDSNFGVLRFLSWMGNGLNQTTWALRKPSTYYSGVADYWPPTLWAGTTTTTNNAMTLSAPSGWAGLVDKATVQCRFDRNGRVPVTAVTGGASTILTVTQGATDPVFVVNEVVKIDGAAGGTWTGLNGTWTVTAVGTGNITVNCNSSGFTGTYTASSANVGHNAMTLAVGGTAAKPVLDKYYNSTTNFTILLPVATRPATFTYDADLGGWTMEGGNNEDAGIGIATGACFEHALQLCAEVGAHPYFTLPPHAADPISDLFPSLAAMIRDTWQAGPTPWMKPKFEGPNETWNTASAFKETFYANAKAVVYGWGTNQYNAWYGKVMSLLGQAMSTVFGGDRTKYDVLCGVQTVAAPSSCNDRMTSATWIASGSVQSGYVKSAAYNWVTHVVGANYYTPALYNTATETTLATAWSGGDPTAIETYAASCTTGGSFTLDSVLGYFTAWKAWAKGFGVNKMAFYEGGYSPDLNGTNDNFKQASKSASTLNHMTFQNYRNLVGLNDATFTVEFPSCFQFTSNPYPNGDAWSILSDIYQSPTQPQYEAHRCINTNKTRLYTSG